MHVSSNISVPGQWPAENISENSVELIPDIPKGTSSGPIRTKKGKPGLFASLLDGLTGKSRKAAVSSHVKDSLKSVNVIPEKDEFISWAAGSLFHLNPRNIAFSGKNDSLNKNLNAGPVKKEIPLPAGPEENRLSLSRTSPEAPAKGAERRSERTMIRNASQETEASFRGFTTAKDASSEEGRERLVLRNNNLPEAAEKTNIDAGEKDLSASRNNRSKTTAEEIFQLKDPESRQDQIQRQVDTIVQKPEESRESSRNSEPRRKRAERGAVESRDLRTGEMRPNSVPDTLISSSQARGPDNFEIEIPVELNLAGNSGAGGKTQEGISRNTVFENALAQELQENLNTDIVRQASVIVRNGGEGTIRLSLKPESLGNVKIRLEMTENKITGHIIVESSEAFRAFERELPVLEKAFQDSGFSETNLDMSLAQDNGNFGQEWRREGDVFQMTPDLAASRYESETDRIEEAPEGISSAAGRTAVNMLI